MNRKTAREMAESLVSQMTMKEMLSQLVYDAPAVERLNIPAYNWWNEALHGVARAGTATVFPQAIGLGATFDRKLIGEIADTIATEGRAKYNVQAEQGDRDIYKGLTFWSPNVNIFRDPRWGRGHETYGEDPYLTGELGKAFVKGLQGDGETMKAAACAKHFAVHSGPEGERHRFDAKASKKDLWETYLPAFRKLIQDADVEGVMGAYNRLLGEPCCGSRFLQHILRDEWGFEGYFVSDCWAIRDFYESHKVSKNAEDAAALAMREGCDLNCGCSYHSLGEAVSKGKVSKERIREAAVRLFTTRYLLGIMPGQKSEFDGIGYDQVASEEHLLLSRRAAEESIVLLKNDGILPLEKDQIRSIAVIGPNADSCKALIGNYHGTASHPVTVLEGIRNYAGPGTRIYYSEGCDIRNNRVENLAKPDDRISEAVACAKMSDLVVLCVGLDETLEGEEGDTGNSYASGDKMDLLLPASQRRLMEALAKTGKKMIVLLMAGSDLDLSFAAEHANAVLDLFYSGEMGGEALARILFGEVSPGGKLPVTFYESLDDLPEFTDYSMEGRTYRYLRKSAQYPFGYGLTYGKLHAVSFTVRKGEDGLPEAEVLVRNDGERAASDVLQLYIHADGAKDEQRNWGLCGFERVCLKPGEEKKLHIRIDEEALLTVNQDGEAVRETDTWSFYAGFSQPDPLSESLTGFKVLREVYQEN